MVELWIFLKALLRDWVGWMCGVFGLAWTVTTVSFSAVPSWIFAVLCILAFAYACFRTWRTAYLEAHAYDEATFQHAQEVFKRLTDSEKKSLERVLIEKSVNPNSIPRHDELEQTGFLVRDPALGRCGVNPEYGKILARLLREWKAGSGPI